MKLDEDKCAKSGKLNKAPQAEQSRVAANTGVQLFALEPLAGSEHRMSLAADVECVSISRGSTWRGVDVGHAFGARWSVGPRWIHCAEQGQEQVVLLLWRPGMPRYVEGAGFPGCFPESAQLPPASSNEGVHRLPTCARMWSYHSQGCHSRRHTLTS
jgi:hypothetical protein